MKGRESGKGGGREKGIVEMYCGQTARWVFNGLPGPSDTRK